MTLPRSLELCRDLTGTPYAEFIRYAFAISTEGYFVVREEVEKGPNIAVLLERLGPNLISEQKVNEWPGTQLLGGLVATLYVFALEEPVMTVLLSVTDHLYGWQQPDLPEDIGFRDREGKAVIESTIHEHFLSVALDDSRRKLLERQFTKLAQTLFEPEPP